ncbi:MAG: S49 family peptidase [Acidiferrobacterales bacterium]|nr:S49 family peptidase [Acidiferrobacterales bacterium]
MFKRNKTNTQGLPGTENSAGATAGSTANTNAILQELAIDYMHDKKIKRRWKIALFCLFGLYLISILVVMMGDGEPTAYSKPHTAVVQLFGIIGTNEVSARQVNSSLRNAFEAENAQGVILEINSPGGSPVQSADINSEILRLKALYPDKPLHVVMSDVAASGGYFVAASADKIFANRSSIVGSIGVRMDSFGFVGAMEKFGIERRSITAGDNKSILDPFLPMQEDQKAHAEVMLGQVHQHFIDVVKAGRGDKLADNPDLFSGLFWTGEEAQRLGLIDDFGNVASVSRDEFGLDEMVNYTYQPNWLEKFSRQLGVSIGTGIAKVLGGQYQIN